MNFSGNRPWIGELKWDPDKSLDLFTLLRLIRMYSSTGVIPAELIACIFFEESGFCNVRQTKGRDDRTKIIEWGPGVGFGQTQIYDPEKREFFRSIGYNNNTRDNSSGLPLITFDIVTSNPRFSVFITCRYLEYVWQVKEKEGKAGINSVLGAQTGAGGTGSNAGRNALLIPRWKAAAADLSQQLAGLTPDQVDKKRERIAQALNSARHPGFAIPYPNYKDYWKYVVPSDMGAAIYAAA